MTHLAFSEKKGTHTQANATIKCAKGKVVYSAGSQVYSVLKGPFT